jgi:hypothetical protein
MRTVNKFLVPNPEGKRPLGRPASRWYDILQFIFKKQDGRLWNGFMWLSTGTYGKVFVSRLKSLHVPLCTRNFSAH